MRSSSTGPKRPDLDRLSCIGADGARIKIHTADVRGRYQSRKKILWTILIGVYLALPWMTVAGRPAVLIDIAQRHFYLFGHTFDAQDFWLTFFPLSGVGFALIVLSALYGRVWCGYACPQTVFLEGVFRRVERLFEGSAQQQRRAAARGMTGGLALRRTGKYLTWAAISFVLSHTLLGYFMPAREVLAAIRGSPSAHPTAFWFVTGFGLLIYFNFAWFREQLCIVICPYGRLQGVLSDRDTINIGYDSERGEPRGHHTVAGRGACIDCFRCVAVCPTGIDIRNGTQLECVGCANCIDACDEVMDKLGQPRGLVRYDSERGFEAGTRRFVRPRLWLYAVLLLIGVGVFALAAVGRSPFEAKLSRQQGASYTLDGETLSNALSLHFVNKSPDPMTFTLAPVDEGRLAWTVPVRSLTLASFGDQRVPLFVALPRASFVPGQRAHVQVTAGGVATTLPIELLGPEKR